MTDESDEKKFANLKRKLQEDTMFMDGLSEELNAKFFKGKHTEFQEAVEGIIESLDSKASNDEL